MGKKSNHYYRSLYCRLTIMKYICFVITIIGACKMRAAFAVTAMETTEHNYSVASVPIDFNESTYSSTSRTVAMATADFDLLNANAVDGAPLKGWQCHCWNSTNGLESVLECRCEGSALQRIPQRLHVSMQRLAISNAGLKLLRIMGLRIYGASLQDIIFDDMQHFEAIEPGAFSNLVNLRSISISNAPRLTHLAASTFEGISSTFRSLRILYCGLKQMPNLMYLSSGIILNMIDLEGNQIELIQEKSVNIRTDQLSLDNNALTYINNSAFFGSEIAKLSFKGNRKLQDIHPNAFAGILNIIELDLSSTSIKALPTNGLERLEVLRIQNTHSLKTIPSVYTFQRHDPYRHAQRIKYLADLHKKCMNGKLVSDTENGNVDAEKTAELNRTLVENSTMANVRIKRFIDDDSDEIFFKQFRSEEIAAFYENDTAANNLLLDESGFIHPITGAPISYQDDNTDNDNFVINSIDFGEFMDSTADVSPNNLKHATCGILSVKKIDVKCYPIPNALNPCEDVMGSQWLRTSVWMVVFLAVFGNIAVLLVMFSNWNEVTVPKFLMSHLAFADLCLGLYLMLIAAIDIHTMGEYFNHAFDWQYGAGCRVAGFLTVFANHLSVFTLTIITVERWYAITHAINLNKRIKIKAASCIMICGWIYSITMSSLPLFGFSNYSSTSICLPMEARDPLDNVYLLSIIAINGLAFCVIAICYARIYFSLGKETRKSARHASHGEMTVAKKMALLVFTNFACWAPIAFFGLTALAGLPLIDVGKSKILLVFFYPLNSCADPYLYAILTTQYQRDLFMLLSKYGFCQQKAQQYKLNYSLPTINQTCPLPLLDHRHNSPPDQSINRKPKCGDRQIEEFV